MRSSIDERAIMNDLDPNLQEEVGLFLLSDTVAKNPLFVGVPEAALARLVTVVKPVFSTPGQTVVEAGKLGTNMFMLMSGTMVLVDDHDYDDLSTLPRVRWADGGATGPGDVAAALRRVEDEHGGAAPAFFPAVSASVAVVRDSFERFDGVTPRSEALGDEAEAPSSSSGSTASCRASRARRRSRRSSSRSASSRGIYRRT